MSDDLAAALAEICTDAFGEPLTVTGLTRLSGGASRETWSFDAGGHPLILRRDPPSAPNPEGMAREASCFVAAAEAGVPEPVLRAHGDGRSGIGAGIGAAFLLMDRLDGETIPRKLLRDERWAGVRPRLAREFGTILARIHAVPLDRVPGLADGAGFKSSGADAAARLAGLRAQHDAYGEPRPALELAFRVLADTLPAPVAPQLVHGDFRNGNLLIGSGPDGDGGVRAVLDWELAHVGDPREDLGWVCTKAWRFGSALPVGGFGTRDELLDGYAEVAGVRPDPEALRWWETFGAVHWAVICRRQAERHLSGAEHSVEMAVLGRRIAESEHDALLALGLTEPLTVEDPLVGAFSGSESLHDRPTVDELLSAVAGFLTDELPAADPRTRFLSRVAANALTIARRELRVGAAQQEEHRRRLAALGCADDTDLAAGIRDGALDTGRDDVVAAVRAATTAKLVVANPKYLALPG
ncbi:MAG: phosphotransferase family protein [Pseudonocardia sp.]|nr:phosphotransferase family protein [Pseudonocardia sp.]